MFDKYVSENLTPYHIYIVYIYMIYPMFLLIKYKAMSEFTDSFDKVSSSINTQLIAFLQVKYDEAQISPLTTHPTTMLVALSSLLVYYVLHVMLLRFPGRAGAFLGLLRVRGGRHPRGCRVPRRSQPFPLCHLRIAISS